MPLEPGLLFAEGLSTAVFMFQPLAFKGFPNEGEFEEESRLSFSGHVFFSSGLVCLAKGPELLSSCFSLFLTPCPDLNYVFNGTLFQYGSMRHI